MTMDPNSSDGLVIRAEMMEEDAEKLDGKRRESKLTYARLLREISLKNWTVKKNREFISKNMSEGTPRRTSMPSKYMRITQVIVFIITFWFSWNYITGLIDGVARTI